MPDIEVSGSLKDLLDFLQPFAVVIVGCIVIISIGYAVKLMRSK